jgi:phosphoesterase RecJ-like protein
MENISNFPRNIAGVCVAATVRESKDGKSKLSVRATPEYDAASICEKFGGGGHRGAAGASISLSVEEAAKAVEKAMLEL